MIAQSGRFRVFFVPGIDNRYRTIMKDVSASIPLRAFDNFQTITDLNGVCTT